MRNDKDKDGKVNFLYNFYLTLAFPIVKVFYPCKARGLELVPDGPAVICANHSNLMDPVILAVTFGHRHKLFFMAKAELFKIPVLGAMLKAVGAFPVHRGEADIGAIRTAMKHLKNGHKVMLFPEGTRVPEDQAVEAKTGAIRIAAKTGAPILPVYLTRGPKAFHRSDLVVGRPFSQDIPPDKNYEPLARELMENIYVLEPDYEKTPRC